MAAMILHKSHVRSVTYLTRVIHKTFFIYMYTLPVGMHALAYLSGSFTKEMHAIRKLSVTEHPRPLENIVFSKTNTWKRM